MHTDTQTQLDSLRLRLAGEGHLPEAPARTWRPRNNWLPGSSEHVDSIARAESALEHVERQLENLRILMHLDSAHEGPRAA